MDRFEKIRLTLDGVPETLLLPLWGRAAHARRADAFLHDPTTLALVERLDYDFASLEDKLTPYSELYWARRAWLLDGLVKAFSSRHADAWIVNIGAGLDTTFFRTDNGRMHWIDFDVPEVAAVRRRLLPEGPRNFIREGSIFDENWPTALDIPKGKPVLLVSGGVLFYFAETQLRPLFQRIARVIPAAEMAFDVLSHFGADATEKYLRRIGMKDPRIQWRTKSPQSIRQWLPDMEVLGILPIFKGMPTIPNLSLRVRVMIALTDIIPVGRLYHLRLPGS